MLAHLRSTLIRRTALAGAAMALAATGVGGAYMHLMASPASAAPQSTPTHKAAPGAEPGGHHRGHRHPPLVGALVRDTAKLTGRTPAQVVADLKAGKTIDQIAGSQAATVKQDVMARAKTRLDRALSKGRIDAAKQKTLLDQLSARLDTLMSKNLSAAVQHAGQHRGGHPADPAAPPASGAPAAA